MFYRVNQFFSAIFSKITVEDETFINRYLTNIDKEFFYKLPTHEKKHCINVARYVLNNTREENEFVIRASLLHDIGKINSGLNPILKGVIVIMNAICEGGTRKLQFIRPVNVYYNHSEIGSDIYSGIDKDIAYIIKNHHNHNINDPIIKVIQEADSKN